MSRCKVKTGFSVSFLCDHWDLGVLKDLYPHLFSFAKVKNVFGAPVLILG
jgi:hypothetical protein